MDMWLELHKYIYSMSACNETYRVKDALYACVVEVVYACKYFSNM
jgi:hypothetical protein